MKSLFVSDLHQNTSEDQLLEKFKSVGVVSSISIQKEVVFDHSHCYAVVVFEEESAAKFAMDTLNSELVNNCPLHLKWYKPDAGKIFIRNLDKQIDEGYLYKVFAEFGKIVDYKIAKNHKGKSMGSAFVHFETELAAETCIKVGNENKLRNEIIHIEKYNLCKENDEEKDKLLKEFMMAVRNSLFDSIEDSKHARSVNVSEASTSASFNQESVEDEQREQLRQRLNSMSKSMSILPGLTSKVISKILENNVAFLHFIMENEKAFGTKILALIMEMDC